MSRSTRRRRRAAIASLGAMAAVLSIVEARPRAPIPPRPCGPPDDRLFVRDIASKGSDIAVAWQEKRTGGPASYLRLSDDGGEVFGPRFRLGGPGDSVRDVQVDVCADQAFAISAVSESPGAWDVGLAVAPFGGLGEDLDQSFRVRDPPASLPTPGAVGTPCSLDPPNR